VTATSVSIGIVNEAVISDAIDDTEIHSADEILKDLLNDVVV